MFHRMVTQVHQRLMEKHAIAFENQSDHVGHIPGVADVYIPQDMDYRALRFDIDRIRAGELGLSEKKVVTNVITGLTSNQMIAPNVWIDPTNGNN
jgi:hypothetical protein